MEVQNDRIYLVFPESRDLLSVKDSFKFFYDVSYSSKRNNDYHHACMFFPTDYLGEKENVLDVNSYYGIYVGHRLYALNQAGAKDMFNGSLIYTDSQHQFSSIVRYFDLRKIKYEILGSEYADAEPVENVIENDCEQMSLF